MFLPLLRTLLSTLFTIAIATTSALAGSPPPEATDVDHSTLTTILRATVRDERVDYAEIRDRHLASLDAYLDRLAAVDPSELDEQSRLPFYINLYNASMIRAVVERYEPGFTPSAADFRIFKEPLVRLGDKRITLDHLEHEIVRKQFREPRIHVALVCAARSCPPLLPRTYTAADLERTLESNMRRFVNDPSRNQIDHANRRLELSSIFDWFAEDFGGKQALATYVDRYTDADVSEYSVSFLEYDWRLNSIDAPD